MLNNTLLRTFVLSLSLSNLLFLKLWMKLLPYEKGRNLFLAYSPFNSYLAIIMNVFIWGGVFFLLLYLGGRNKKTYSWTVISLSSLVGIVATYGFALSYFSFAKLVFKYGHTKVICIEFTALIIVMAWIFAIAKYRDQLAHFCTVIIFMFAPYIVVTLVQATSVFTKLEPKSQFHPHSVDPVRSLHNPFGINVVWIIFDETDYRLCFEKRPVDLQLPAFDRFRKNAFWATRAYSPSDATQVSLPALLTGIPLKTTKPVGARQLDLIRADSSALVDFGSQETIFDRIKNHHGSTALFGWFLPYSRVMHNVDLAHDYPRYSFFTSDKLLNTLLVQWLEICDTRFIPVNNTLLGNNHIDILKSMQSDVLSAVKNQNPSLMFLHYPLPHSPYIYNRKNNIVGFNKNSHEGYLDNMALADRCLAELRKEMEQKGSWDNSMIIISSDHHWRTNTYDGVTDFEHVPFMVKLPHQQKGMTYGNTFNTVLTQELIIAAVEGKVTSPEDVTLWLDKKIRTEHYDKKVIYSINQPEAD